MCPAAAGTDAAFLLSDSLTSPPINASNFANRVSRSFGAVGVTGSAGMDIKTDGRFLKESDLNETVIAKIRKLNDLALQRGQTLAEMSLSWLLAQDVVTSVLIGASKAEQILDNIKALENLNFSAEELELIDKISK